MNDSQKNERRDLPPLAWCPACKHAMQIKNVRPGLRKNTEAITYVCDKCGASKKENSDARWAAT